MRILLIRHGDPDYVNDTLTEKGRREAALLAKRAVSMNMGECYKSPGNWKNSRNIGLAARVPGAG